MLYGFVLQMLVFNVGWAGVGGTPSFENGKVNHMDIMNIAVEAYLSQPAVDVTITGVVLGENGNPLPGATITVEGSTTGTVTDLDGVFSITVPEGAILVFSYIGYEAMRIPVDNQSEIDVTLKPDMSSLEEVVVVGYGTQRRGNLTGAVDQVTSEVFENRPLTNLTQGLQGVLPNVNIRLMDGNPSGSPSINIRGATSIGAGGNALVLIDNVEGDPSLVNPNDIESITVLKDAASASIYGARGAFGVILITTKRAPEDRMLVTYSSNYSRKQPTTVFDHVTDGYTYAKMFNEAHLGRTDYATPPLGVNKTIRFSPEYLAE